MKVITKKVFYCEFCKKHRLTKNSMQHHEDRCFFNPGRSCTLCDDYEDLNYEIETINNSPDHMVDYEFKRITVNGDECPACILGFAYQNKVESICVKTEDGTKPFDYKEARDKFLADRASEERDWGGY